jgi:preprotein translocase subunit SecD
VNNDDVADAMVVEDPPIGFGVAVRLLEPGAARMRQATAGHLGRPVAILIDGIVAIAPVVRSPIADAALISGGYTRAEAERIASGIGGR